MTSAPSTEKVASPHMLALLFFLLLAVIFGVWHSDFFQMLFFLSYAPFWLLLVVLLFVRHQEKSSPLLPPLFCCTALSPFVTWDALVITDSIRVAFYLAVCLILFTASLCWLIQVLNQQLLKTSLVLACPSQQTVTPSDTPQETPPPAAVAHRHPRLATLARINIRLFIYLSIIPLASSYAANYQTLLHNPAFFIQECWQFDAMGRDIRLQVITVCLLISLALSITLLYYSRKTSTKHSPEPQEPHVDHSDYRP